MFHKIYQELIFFVKEHLYALAVLKKSDRMAFFAALGIIISTFLPWFTYRPCCTVPGLMVGGGVNLALAIITIALVKNALKHQITNTNNRLLNIKLKRISFGYIITGASSFFTILFYIISLLFQPIFSLGIFDIRFGLYFAGFFSIIIFVCGLERFS